jgi:hypothetical protein
MKKRFDITINGQVHPIAFVYGAVKLLGQFLKTPGYDETVSEVGRLLKRMTEAEKKGSSIPFELTDALVYTIQAGIYGGNPETDVDFDDVAQAMIEDSEILKTVFICFSEYMPRTKKAPETGKKNARTMGAKK